MIFHKTILILEDNLLAVSKILERLNTLEQDQPYELSLILLTDYTQVRDYINSNNKAKFDIVLLDRDCKLGGSFHDLEIERFGVDKVISISSVPEWNEQAKKRGVNRVILKDYGNLDEFSEKVVNEVEEMVSKMPLVEN